MTNAVTRTAPTTGAARSLAKSAQVLLAEGGPSQASADFSNAYGEWPCATTKPNVAVARRHVSATTLSLESSSEGKATSPTRGGGVTSASVCEIAEAPVGSEPAPS